MGVRERLDRLESRRRGGLAVTRETAADGKAWVRIAACDRLGRPMLAVHLPDNGRRDSDAATPAGPS